MRQTRTEREPAPLIHLTSFYTVNIIINITLYLPREYLNFPHFLERRVNYSSGNNSVDGVKCTLAWPCRGSSRRKNKIISKDRNTITLDPHHLCNLGLPNYIARSLFLGKILYDKSGIKRNKREKIIEFISPPGEGRLISACLTQPKLIGRVGNIYQRRHFYIYFLLITPKFLSGSIRDFYVYSFIKNMIRMFM